MAPFSPQALTPQKRQIEQSLEKAENVLRSGGIPLNKRTFYGSCKRTKLFSKPRSSQDCPTKDQPSARKTDVYEFDENGETPRESLFTHVIKPHEIGFPNPPGTNICWMNATLQIILGMKYLIDDLEAPVNGSSVSRNHYSAILQAFLDVVRQHKRGRLLPVHKDLSNLRNALATLDSGFACENQQDAPEFLIRLLDSFRENFYEVEKNKNGETIALKELKCVNSNVPMATQSPAKKPKVNPICDNLQFCMKEEYSCISCGMQSSRKQEHLALYVDIPAENEGSSITSALEQYMKIHMRELRCEKCKGEQCQVKTTFSQLPRILLIQVKRYTCLEHLTQKITSSIGIPLELNVCSVVDSNVIFPKPWPTYNEKENDKREERSTTERSKTDDYSYDDETEEEEEEEQHEGKQSKFSYILTGILSHQGDNPNAGHYVADVYHHVPRRWYHYDDENVECVREDEILDESREQSGYLFVYTYKPLHDQLLSKPRDQR